MAAYTIKTVQKIPVSLEKAWQFFSSPGNLKLITPESMGFQIISGVHDANAMYAGQIIEYRVKPLLGIPVYWMTEITQVRQNEYFIDEQRFGPYKFWQHQHHFKVIPGGVEMTDIIHYKNRLGILGRLANRLFVAKKLRYIFNYRSNRVEEFFGAWPSA